MSTITPVSPSPVTPPQASAVTAIPPLFKDGAEWHRALGEVPLSRIVFDPWPGTATEEDVIRLVEGEDRLVELVNGTLVEKGVGYLESKIAAWLIYYLNQYLEHNDIGTVTGEAGMLRLLLTQIRIPDVAFVKNDRLSGHNLEKEHAPKIAPNLAVEIISESNTLSEMKLKRREYFASGAELVWIIEPRLQTVAVYRTDSVEPDQRLTVSDILDGEGVLPGFTLPVQKLFRSQSSSNQ